MNKQLAISVILIAVALNALTAGLLSLFVLPASHWSARTVLGLAAFIASGLTTGAIILAAITLGKEIENVDNRMAD